MTTKITITVPDEVAKDLIAKYDKPKVWKPEIGEKYWYLSYSGLSFRSTWESDQTDLDTYAIGNVSPTKETAELKRNKQIALTTIERYAEQLGFIADWSDEDQIQWSVCLNLGKLRTTSSRSFKCSTLPDYSSHAIAEQALADLFDEYKLVLGVTA